MDLTHYCLFLIALSATSFAFSASFIPKSFYVIDKDGQQSEVFLIRDRRDIPMFRERRGVGSSSNGGAGAPINFEDFIPNLSDLENLSRNIPTGGAGGGASSSSFASASSSSSSGGGSGGGYGNAEHAGGLGAGQQAGYNGPILFSRVGETEGTGGHVSTAAEGPRGAFSSSSISSDGGKVKYSAQSGKY